MYERKTSVLIENDLKKLSRRELLILLLRQMKKNETLEAQINELEQKLSDKMILVEERGSLSDASVALCDVLENTQKAAEMYAVNSKKMAEEEAEAILKRARTEAGNVRLETRRYLDAVNAKIKIAAQYNPEFENLLSMIPAPEYENPNDSLLIGD